MTASSSPEQTAAEDSSAPMLLADRLAAAGANPAFCDRLRAAEQSGDPARVARLLERLNPSAMAGARARMDPRDWESFRRTTATYLRWSRAHLLPAIDRDDRPSEIVRDATGSALLLAGLVALGTTVAPFTLAVGAVTAMMIVARRRNQPLHVVAGRAALWLASRGADVARLVALGADAALDTSRPAAQLPAADQSPAPGTAAPEPAQPQQMPTPATLPAPRRPQRHGSSPGR